MDEIIKFLKSMGLGDQEIQKVLRETPVNPQGLTGTNVATGVFTKTNPKSKELVKDFPLVVERIGNPFEVNYYKGKSRDEVIKMASEHVKFLEDEIAKLADQLLNKNLQLTEQQRINLAKNLETKRRIEKDFEAFKTKPKAPVVDIKTGETVSDVETLKEKSGLIAPPTTDIGRIDLRNKQMLQKAEEFYKSQDEFQKEEAARQALIAKQYEGKGYAGGVFGPSSMYRSVARNFLLDQNAKGKIKLTDDVVKNLEERNYISGGQPLMYPDPIRIMRLHYGDDVFEKIPLDKIKTGAPSEIIEEMSKININPVKVEAPATPGGYMTPGEIKANIEELENIEKMIKRRESRFADMTDQEIKNELEHYGAQKNAFEVAFGYDHPKEYEEYLKSIEKKKPEKFAKGGSVESLGLDYLTGIERDYPGRSNFEKGTVPRMLKFLIDKLAEEKDFNRKLLERANPKAVKDLYISEYGKLPSAEEIKEIVNKQLQGKYSMETVNPKTGEVTIPKEPVKIAQKYNEDIIKAADEIYPSYDDPKIAADQIVDSYAQMKYGLEDQYGLSNKERMDLYRQAYDYVMDYNRGAVGKTTGTINISDEATAKAFTDFARENDPEGFKKIQKIVDDINNKNALEEFDIKNRKPNAIGGRVGYAEGSDGAPSITLDTHDKAPGNMDKYPIKVGNLELGITGAMSSGQSTPDPYVKVNTANRDLTVRGKYNVPDTGISLLGDVGDIRSKSRTDINMPQYNYKESIRDVMRLNPYSVGIEYAPDQNRKINLRYDNQGNVSLRGEARFAKGGLGYLMGE